MANIANMLIDSFPCASIAPIHPIRLTTILKLTLLMRSTVEDKKRT